MTFRDSAAAAAAAAAASGHYAGRHSTSSTASPAVVATMGSIGDPALLPSRDPSDSAGGSAGRGSGAAALPSSSGGVAGASGGGVAGASGGGGSGGAGSSAGAAGSGGQVGAIAARGMGGVSSMLKARSDMAVLRDLKIGPLLGRGSYGRVYKGRWKAVTVAVKIIEHSERSPGTASSGGKRINIGRESLLATQMSHPNIVQSYHISTMTVSERNALARGCLGTEPATSALDKRSPQPSAQQGEDDDAGASGSNHSSDNEPRDVLETWMIMEFCEKGSLERAVSRGKFVRREDRQPEMIGVYKALLDTASGLDYLHSIGVVHGDLKSANVLLKGSARDVRGFCCKIADFGLSRVLDMDATHISTRTYGTIVYMPSELLLTGRMTTATDIYSFGLMMWELFTSQRVFEEGLSIGQIFYMIAYQNWRPTVPANCPPGYTQIMTACWHQDPEQRPTVQQLLRSLQKLYVAEKQRLAAGRQQGVPAAAGPVRISMESDRLRNADVESAGGAASTSGGNTPQHTSGAAAPQQAAAGAAAAAALAGDRPAKLPRGTVHPAAATAADAFGSGGRGSGGSVGARARAAAARSRAARDAPRGSGGAAYSSGGGAHSSGGPVHSSGGGGNLQHSSGGGGPVHSGGSGGPAHGSGGAAGSGEGQEEQYQPWAEAVSQNSMMPTARSSDGKRMHDRDAAAAAAGGWVSPKGQQQQQQPASAAAAQGALRQPAPASGGVLQPFGVMQQQQQQQVQVQPALQELPGGGEIEPAIDSEALFSGGSGYPNVSSSGNALTYGTVEEAAQGYDDTSGFLDGVRKPPMYPFGQYQQQSGGGSPGMRGPGAGPVPAAAAQGFLDAIEMANMQPGGAVQAQPGWQAGNSSEGQQRVGRPGLPGLAAGSSSSWPASSACLQEWSSVSTGTMPSVLGDSTLTSPSSTGGRDNSRALGSQDFHRINSAFGRPGSSDRRSAAGEGPGSAMGPVPEREPEQRVQLAAPSGWFAGSEAAQQAAAAAVGGARDSSARPAPTGREGGNGGSITSALMKAVGLGGKRGLPASPAGGAAAAAPARQGGPSAAAGSSSPLPPQPVPAAAAAVPGSSAVGRPAVTPAAAAAGTPFAPTGVVNAAGFPAMVSVGMLQTVPESFATSENTSPSATVINHPVPQQVLQQQQQQQQQQQVGDVPDSAAAAASPFAALAQRAGSLFAPLPPQ
ncbi:hypothetical protein COO60DRAFT_768059 [Scenedesmus sp. NREL 46B-D3]|nr:hypothetical protein COO60DRAFT_768059 [Scenedesmus sp. NREL 46B-D3]